MKYRLRQIGVGVYSPHNVIMTASLRPRKLNGVGCECNAGWGGDTCSSLLSTNVSVESIIHYLRTFVSHAFGSQLTIDSVNSCMICLELTVEVRPCKVTNKFAIAGLTPRMDDRVQLKQLKCPGTPFPGPCLHQCVSPMRFTNAFHQCVSPMRFTNVFHQCVSPMCFTNVFHQLFLS